MKYLVLLVVMIAGCSENSQDQNTVNNPAPVANGTPATDTGDKVDAATFLEEFRNRKKYTSLDVETLRSIPDDKLEQAIMDYIFHKLRTGSGEEATLKSLSPGLRAFWHTRIVEMEVNNGGFNQYYWNTDGRYSSDAVEAFEFFSANGHAALMRKANAIRTREAPAIQAIKDKDPIGGFSGTYKLSKLGPVDDEFYELKEDVSALRIAKVRESPELFTGD